MKEKTSKIGKVGKWTLIVFVVAVILVGGFIIYGIFRFFHGPNFPEDTMHAEVLVDGSEVAGAKDDDHIYIPSFDFDAERKSIFYTLDPFWLVRNVDSSTYFSLYNYDFETGNNKLIKRFYIQNYINPVEVNKYYFHYGFMLHGDNGLFYFPFIRTVGQPYEYAGVLVSYDVRNSQERRYFFREVVFEDGDEMFKDIPGGHRQPAIEEYKSKVRQDACQKFLKDNNNEVEHLYLGLNSFANFDEGNFDWYIGGDNTIIPVFYCSAEQQQSVKVVKEVRDVQSPDCRFTKRDFCLKESAVDLNVEYHAWVSIQNINHWGDWVYILKYKENVYSLGGDDAGSLSGYFTDKDGNVIIKKWSDIVRLVPNQN